MFQCFKMVLATQACNSIWTVVIVLSIGGLCFWLSGLGSPHPWTAIGSNENSLIKWGSFEKGVCQPKIAMNCKYANVFVAECSYLEVASEYRWLCFAHRFHVQRVGDKGTWKPRRASGHCNPHLGRLWQWSQVAGDSPNLLTASSLRSASCHPRFKWWSCENLGSQPGNPSVKCLHAGATDLPEGECEVLYGRCGFLGVGNSVFSESCTYWYFYTFLYTIYCIYITYIYIYMFMYTSFWNALGIFGC